MCVSIVTLLVFHVTFSGICIYAGATEKDPEEAQRLRPGAGVSAGDEGCVLQHQRGQETDGEVGDSGGMAVPYRGLGGGLQINCVH